MKSTLALFVAIFLYAISVSGQEVKWTSYTSNTGAYSVLLPAEPKLEEQEGAAPGGTKFTQYMVKASLSDQVFMAGYFDIVPGWTYSLEKGRDGMVKAVDGALLSDELISLGGSPGRKLRVRAKVGTLSATDLARVYNVNGRVYILQSLYVETTDEAAFVARANKFFDSFTVKDR